MAFTTDPLIEETTLE